MREVKRLRQSRGWNQTELAFHAGLAPSVISQIENGKRDPSAGTLKKLAQALDVGVGDLFPKKAQAPLPLEENEQRGADPYTPWKVYVDSRANTWERNIAKGNIHGNSIIELSEELKDLFETLGPLGLEEKREQPSSYAYTFGPVTDKAISRMEEILDLLVEERLSQIEGSELEEMRKKLNQRSTSYSNQPTEAASNE